MKQLLATLILALSALFGPLAEALAGEWGLGIGIAAQQPPQIGTDSQVVVLPFPSYEGERLSMDFGSVAYALAATEKFRFAIEGQLRFDGYDPDDSRALAGLEERDLTLDAGFSLTAGDKWGIASLKFLTDALGVHKGYEVSASYQYPIEFRKWTLVPGISAKWPSEELVEYYYGVRVDEARPDRPAYVGGSVMNTAVSLGVAYDLADRWEIIGGAEYTHLGDEITDSPIISKDHETIMFSAIVYRF